MSASCARGRWALGGTAAGVLGGMLVVEDFSMARISDAVQIIENLFGPIDEEPGVLQLNNSVGIVEYPRLTKQCIQILRLFIGRPFVMNSELHALAFNHTARVSDLRQNGFDIELFRYDTETGQGGYRLNGWGRAHKEYLSALTEDEFLSWFEDQNLLFSSNFLITEVWPLLKTRLRTICRYRIEIVKTELTQEDFEKILVVNGYQFSEKSD